MRSGARRRRSRSRSKADLVSQEKARGEGARLLNEAKAEIESEKQNAIRDIRAQVAELSVLIAEKILKQNLDSDRKQMDMIERLLDEVSAEKGNQQ